MRQEIFSVFDMAANCFMEPFCTMTVDTAIRSFRQCVETEGHQFTMFCEDYALYHIGSFEDGLLQGREPSKIAMAAEFVKRPRLEGTTDA